MVAIPRLRVHIDASSASGHLHVAGGGVDDIERTRAARGSVARNVLNEDNRDIGAARRPHQRAPSKIRGGDQSQMRELSRLGVHAEFYPDLVREHEGVLSTLALPLDPTGRASDPQAARTRPAPPSL